ncbi:MAG TPA: hypothetical protein VHJ83_13210 [Micromonosporaceae bacterium]|nr:hypothetical protein [Micromonosporaceae bacterium]
MLAFQFLRTDRGEMRRRHRAESDAPTSAPAWLWPLLAAGVAVLVALWWWAL